MGKNAQRRRATKEVRKFLRRLEQGKLGLTRYQSTALERRRKEGEYIPNRAARRR